METNESPCKVYMAITGDSNSCSHNISPESLSRVNILPSEFVAKWANPAIFSKSIVTVLSKQDYFWCKL